MTLKEMADEVLLRSGPTSVYAIAGGIRVMFAERISVDTLMAELNRPGSHFIRVGYRHYTVHPIKRANWLAERFGLK